MGLFLFCGAQRQAQKKEIMTHHFFFLSFFIFSSIPEYCGPLKCLKVSIQLLNHDLRLDMVLFSKSSPIKIPIAGREGQTMTETVGVGR